MDQDTQPMDEQELEGQLLRAHLFQGDLLALPPPEEDLGGWLPAGFTGNLPALIYPPLAERGLNEGDNVNLQISPYHIFYGALREIAESADADRSEALKQMVLQMNPHVALDMCQLARENIEQDVEAALLHYELALELDDEIYEAVQDSGMCHFALAEAGESEEEQAAQLEEAEELFRRAIELRPTEGLSWWSLARSVAALGRGEEAGAILQQFLQQFPDGNGREMVEHALTQGFQAEQPSEDQMIFAQAQALLQDNPAEAAELLLPLAENYTDSWEVWFLLGRAYRLAGDVNEAERRLRRAARLSPEEPLIWWDLALAYEAEKNWRAGEEAIRKALALDEGNPAFLCSLGRILLGQGDREAAREAIEAARDIIPDDPEVEEAVRLLEGR